MHKFQFIPVGVALIAIIAALPQLKATAIPATTAILNEAPAATVEWIDPVILKQLQAIEPIGHPATCTAYRLGNAGCKNRQIK
jgi:hypothetical protein